MINQKEQRNRRGDSRPRTGLEKDGFESKLLDLARVTKVTGGGKQLRFRAVMVVGNKAGKIGLGVEKGKDVSQAVEKATRKAKNSQIKIPFVGETIPHEVKAKYGPARVLLRPQTKGRGVVAGGAVRVICSLAGIKDISSKLLSRSRNKINIARATMMALGKLKSEARNPKRETPKESLRDPTGQANSSD